MSEITVHNGLVYFGQLGPGEPVDSPLGVRLLVGLSPCRLCGIADGFHHPRCMLRAFAPEPEVDTETGHSKSAENVST